MNIAYIANVMPFSLARSQLVEAGRVFLSVLA